MNTQTQQTPEEGARQESSIQHILVPTDFFECADRAFAYALDVARKFEATVHLLHVILPLEGDRAYSPLKYTPEAGARELGWTINDLMDQTIARQDTDGVEVRKVKKRARLAAAPVILSYAEKQGIDLIVMGTHGRRGLGRFMAGSVAEEVMRRAPCDVLTVRERQPEKESLQRILVPIDFSEHAEVLLQKARQVAVAFEAQVDLLHVIEPLPSLATSSGFTSIYDLVPGIRETSRRQLERLLRDVDGPRLLRDVDGPEVPAEVHLAEGHAAAEIVRFAEEEEIDLVMMASHGLSGLERFFIGSVTERVMRTAPCPVWSLRVLEAPSVPEDEEAAEAATE